MIAEATPLHESDNILLVDIGNSTTTIGAWSGGSVRVALVVPHAELDTFAKHLEELWGALDNPACIAVCSVNAPTFQEIRSSVERVSGGRVLLVGVDLEIPLAIGIDEPKSIGTDRLCCAAAAFALVDGPCVIVDFGTAVTVDCVNADGVFAGGAILPGLKLQAKILAADTDQLPLIEPAVPDTALGQSTPHAMAAGIVFGTAGAVRELVERYATHLGYWPTVVATGGDAGVMVSLSDVIEKSVPDLCLRGIAMACLHHQGSA